MSADVVALFKRLLDPATAAPSRSNYDMISGVTAPDPYTVVFDLSSPYGGFADILSDRQVKIVPRNAVAQLATHPIGTGPFKFVSYTPGDRLILTRNADYFEPGMPKLQGVELRIIPEMSVKIAALGGGRPRRALGSPAGTGQAAQRASQPAGGQRGHRILGRRDHEQPDPAVQRPKGSPRLPDGGEQGRRRGADTVRPGRADDQPDPTDASVLRRPRLSIPPADPAAARKLLAQAGHPNGINIPIIVPVGRPVRERLGVTLQQLAKPGGFDLQVQRVPFSSFDAEVSGKAPLYIDGYFARPTIDTSTYPFLHSGGSWNEKLWHYNDPKVDKALEAARLSGDAAVQKTQYIAMQTALDANPAGFFAYVVNFACAYRKSVGGITTHPMRWFDLRTATVT